MPAEVQREAYAVTAGCSVQRVVWVQGRCRRSGIDSDWKCERFVDLVEGSCLPMNGLAFAEGAIMCLSLVFVRGLVRIPWLQARKRRRKLFGA